jgi:GGDEF domain-containing protein
MDTPQDLDTVRQHIETALQQPLEALDFDADMVMDFGGSVGGAVFPDDGEDAEALLKKADRRMYKQKFRDRPVDSEFPRRRESDPPD